MAEKLTPYATLAATLGSAQTITELFKTANGDDFKAATRELHPDDLASLRTIYRERQKELDGKVRLQDYVGENLNITDIEFWHSATWDNDGVTLRFHLDNSMQQYKALTSSSPIVRFATNLDTVPTPENPVRILLSARPVSDEKRAAAGQKIFTVKRLPDGKRTDGSEGAPF